MTHINDEISWLLETCEPLSICDRNRKIVGVAGPADVIAPMHPHLPKRPLLGWAMLDYQLDPVGELRDVRSVHELVWLVMRTFHSEDLRATLDRNRYRLLFPAGASLEWPRHALADWNQQSPLVPGRRVGRWLAR